MHTSAFRSHLRMPDDPRIAGLDRLDAYSHAQRVMANPVAKKLFDGWQRTYESSDFKGITLDGTCQPNLFVLADEGAPVAASCAAALHLLTTVTQAQRSLFCHTLDAKPWHAWMNPEVYLMRFGLRLDETNAAVRAAILEVLRAGLSAQGFARARALMQVNHFLGELVNAPRVLNEFSYNFNLFGTPSLTEPWGWNFYGHHLCLNCAFIGKQMVLTPVFMGAEPNCIDTGPHAGTQIFDDEENLGLALMRALPEPLQKKARLYNHKRDPAMPPGRVSVGDELHLAGAFQDNRIIPNEGVCVADLPTDLKQAVLQLIETYLAHLPEGPRRARMSDAHKHLPNTWFCWIGGFDDTSAFYYRIQSPVLIIEFDHHAGVFLGNTEPEKFHIHTLVRTPNGNDYGTALIRQHCDCMKKPQSAY
jgi:hypothetical protein